ncbi:hypothetical protein XPN_1490 [Xanthomonas arboricola pv. pruni MAFF 301427]|nr:hypothetical protein XPN_1490 [Xanthomonas arboricola pv. pruni MAFF 301427]
MLAMAVSTALMAATPSFDGARISRDVKELASDAYEGRGPATAGEEKTIAYLSKQFADAGLQPGGDLTDGKRGWTQALPLRRADIVGTPTIALQHAGKPQALTQGKQIAIRAALDGSSKVDIANAPLVFVGYGVKAPERDWDDFKGVDLKGKIAVVLINDPDFETGKGAFDGAGMTYYGRWTYKYEEGARQGALGVLVVHETAPASYGWDTVASSNTNTMFDVVRDNPRAAHPTLEGWIQRDLAADLFKQAGLDFDALKKQAQTRGFKPVELKGQGLSASYQVKSDVITSHNVVARLQGSTHPDETLIYSAHWDHIGVGKPDARGDTIFNGALDNASGTAALLELARGFAAGPKPQRSVVFLAVTAEEKGLLGSEFYASKPLYPLDTTVAVINMDGMSRSCHRAISASMAPQNSNCSISSRPSPASGSCATRPIPSRRRGTSSARTISPSPSVACRRCRMRPGRTGKWAGWPRARPPPTTTPPSAITSRAMSGSRTGPSPVRRAIWACCTRWASSWPIRASGRTGTPIRSSAPPATPARLRASKTGRYGGSASVRRRCCCSMRHVRCAHVPPPDRGGRQSG